MTDRIVGLVLFPWWAAATVTTAVAVAFLLAVAGLSRRARR